jgi:uncharacterized protein YdeI (YjbR/CyaY-like superfamily)
VPAEPDRPPIVAFATPAAWETYLAEHHGDAAGVWLQIAKKGAGVPSVTYAEALDAALCWGWIDGQRRGHDERSYLQRFSPRRARSLWSKRNREHVARLRAAGRMRPPGEAEIERAQADGRWEAAYDPPSTAAVPDDLQAALDASPAAAASFATLNSANRYAILWRLQTAKRPETRARRVAQFVAMLERGEKLH